MYLKFLIYLIQTHVSSYDHFKRTYDYRLAALEKVRRIKQRNKDIYNNALKQLGVNRFKTLSEITKENQQFIQTHPELFPGLNQN